MDTNVQQTLSKITLYCEFAHLAWNSIFVLPLPFLYFSHVHPPVHLLSVCHRGYFNCSYSPCPAVCTVYSDRHYHTFDGLEYDYHSDCQVYLLKVSNVHHGSLFYAQLIVACASNKSCKITFSDKFTNAKQICQWYIVIYNSWKSSKFAYNCRNLKCDGTGQCYRRMDINVEIVM